MKYKIVPSRIIIFTLIFVFFLDGCAVALGVTENPSAVNHGAKLGTEFVGYEKDTSADGSHLIDQLVQSITYSSGEIRFQIPSDVIDPKSLNLHIAGRAVYKDGFSRSLHFLEPEYAENSWVAGKTYSIPFDPDDTELTMDIYVTTANGTIIEKDVDLMSILKLQQKR